MERQPDPDRELQVARYLSAAYVAYAHGQGMDYTRKKYADSPVGNFWLEIARPVIEGMAMAGEKGVPRPAGGTDPIVRSRATIEDARSAGSAEL